MATSPTSDLHVRIDKKTADKIWELSGKLKTSRAKVVCIAINQLHEAQYQ